MYYHEFVNEILKAGGDIDFNMVTETINLVADAASHSVAGKVLRIKKLNIQWVSGGEWYNVTFFDIGERLRPMDTTSIAADFSKAKPFADVYLDDETIKIDISPIPVVDNAGGLKVWKILEITELSSSSDEPSIPEAYQRYTAWGTIRDYFLKKEMFAKAAEAEKEMFKLLDRAIQFYANRGENVPLVMRDGYGDDYGK